jgi:SNF2 family DNA or RNA helicase
MELHQYQKKAIEFCTENKTVFLAMDLGLGKTAVALKIIEQTKQPAIVFAPLRVIYNTWPDEIAIWTPHLTYDILHGPDKSYTLKHSTADILLINFDGIKWFMKEVLKNSKTVTTNTRKLLGWTKRILIVDESSMIKSPSTLRFKSLKKMFPLWGDYRLCLSATPMPNGYHELWSQYFILDKGKSLFDNYFRYRATFFHYTGPPLYKTTLRKGSFEAIKKLIRPVTFRLDAKDHVKMPKVIYNNISLVMPPILRKKYKELEDNFFLEFQGADATAFNAAALSMKLRQFIQGAVYTDAGNGEFYPIHQLKIDALKELIETSVGQPILCPIQFKFELKMIRAFIHNDIPCISGGTPNKLANQHIKYWNEGKLPLLLCHPASLGHGVNLQAGGSNLVWFGLPWSLEHYLQLNGRLIRQGQKSSGVVVNHIIMKSTIDERIVKVLKMKDATQAKLLDALKR